MQMRARRSDPTPRVEGAVRYLASSPGTERQSASHSRRLSGVQVDSSVALLVMVLVMAVELVFHTSVLVDVGRYWSAFHGPVTAQTAQRRPRNDLQTTAARSAGEASRRASFARPGRARVGKVERPTGRTTFPTRARSGCLRCATGRGARLGIPEPPGSRGEAPAAGGPFRVVGLEALPAGGTSGWRTDDAELTTPSVSTRSGLASGLRRSLYRLLTVLVLVGVGDCWRRRFARSSPRFLPTDPRGVEPTSRRHRASVCSTTAGVAPVGAPGAQQQGRPRRARAANRGRSRSPPQCTGPAHVDR
jgi:hypothetical protein